MARNNHVQVRLNNSEYKIVEDIAEEFECSDAEAMRKCIKLTRTWTDEELRDALNSTEFEVISKLMRD